MQYKWTKGFDFIDNSPRYTFDDRLPENNDNDRISVVIAQNTISVFGVEEKFYECHVSITDLEIADSYYRIKYLKDAKRLAIELFEEYCKIYPQNIK